MYKQKISMLLLSVFTFSLFLTSSINANINTSTLNYYINFENPYEPIILIDLDSADMTQPHIIREYFVDENGYDYYIELTFEPDTETRMDIIDQGSASVGTWRASRTGIMNMSYTFNVGRSGTSWTISNGRNHSYSGPFVRFSNPSLRVTQGTSTASFPAEINASVDAELFNNNWVGPIASSTWLMSTTVSNSGWMVTRAN